MKLRRFAIAMLAMPFAMSCYAQDDIRPEPKNSRDEPKGAWSNEVTQANIAETICKGDWIRAQKAKKSSFEVNTLMNRQAHKRGIQMKYPNEFVEDYYFPIELGGSPVSEDNLWPQEGNRNTFKMIVAEGFRKWVCLDKMPLDRAQRVFEGHQWEAAVGNMRVYLNKEHQ